jgi:hypothetical protein
MILKFFLNIKNNYGKTNKKLMQFEKCLTKFDMNGIKKLKIKTYLNM